MAEGQGQNCPNSRNVNLVQKVNPKSYSTIKLVQSLFLFSAAALLFLLVEIPN